MLNARTLCLFATIFAAVAAPLTAGAASGLLTLKTLPSTGASGSTPYDAFTRLSDGTLIGTTSAGGANGAGAVIRLTPSTGVVTDVANFGGASGIASYGPLTVAGDGNFYGTTEFGGARNFGDVFKLTPAGTYTVIYSFKGAGDGIEPYGGLVQGSDGQLYGSTSFSSAARNNGTPSGYGTLFKVTTGGVFTLLHTFNGTDGANCASQMTVGPGGNIYGVTRAGGEVSASVFGFGVVFQLTPTGGYAVLHDFAGTDGSAPACQLMVAADGNLYGTTTDVPSQASSPLATTGYGTIFRIAASGSGFATLWRFSAIEVAGLSSDGSTPSGSLAQLSDGSIYGTLQRGGPFGKGAVFRYKSGAVFPVYGFTGALDGGLPVGGLRLGADGNMYGSTAEGPSGAAGGTIFELIGPPHIGALTPSIVSAGAGAFTLTIDGANFNPQGVSVELNGTPLTVNAVSSATICAAVPSSLDGTVGTYPVIVSNDPNIPPSNTSDFTVTSLPQSRITSLSPSAVFAGAGATTLTITGSGFAASGDTVSFNGAQLSIISTSPTVILATVPASLLTTVGTASVIVSTNNGQPPSIPAVLTIAPPPIQPSISGIMPSVTTAGSLGFVLTIQGSNFTTTGETVKFGPTALSVISASASQIAATVPPSLLATPGTFTVVEDNNRGAAPSNPIAFRVVPSAGMPSIASISPSSAQVNSNGSTVTLSGTGFATSGVSVLYGGVSLVIDSASPNQIVATILPPMLSAPGPYAIQVANGGGSVSNIVTFDVTIPTPRLGSLTPTNIAGGAGSFSLTINGSGFYTGGAVVHFGAASLTPSAISANKIVVAVPASAVASASTVAVTVENIGNSALSNALPFSILSPVPLHTFAAGLQMISTPYDYSGSDPSTLLNVTAKLAVWDPAANSGAGQYDVTSGLAAAFTLGRAYWIRLAAPGTSVFLPGPKASATQPYPITLTTGWNMVGDPFVASASLSTATFTVGGLSLSFAQAANAGVIEPILYTYSAGNASYTYVLSTDSLQPWAGYWIEALQDCTMNIPAPAGS